MKTICLVMIVKNEANQLPRCFSTIKNHIDTYSIVDTGSTDNTIEVIKEQLKDIPGVVHQRPWVNFGHNRTESLKLAKDMADYLILCDADEQLIFADTFNKEELVLDQYLLQYNGNLDYRVPYLINAKLDWSYVGVTHEYLSCNGNFSNAKLDTIKINDYGDGGSKHDKFERDIRLLTEDLERDPHNPRSMFYLANSYRDTNQNIQAIDWYQKRIEAGSWHEEVTCAYLYKGQCQERIGKTEDAIFTYLEGYEYNSNRAECVYNAIRLLRIQGKYKTAYHLAKAAKSIPYPENDILFIDRSVYEHKIDYELSIVTYYANKDEDIKDTFKYLLSRNDVNHQNIISNYKWYCKDLREFEEVSKEYKSSSNSWVYSSPSIFPIENGYGMNIRNVSYVIDRNTGSYGEVQPEFTNGKINTTNTYVELDKNFEIVKEHNFFMKDHNEIAVNGIEDLKVIRHNGELKFTGTKWYDYGKIGIVYGDYDITKDYLEYEKFVSPERRPIEKNWAPFNFDGDLNYVYDWNPVRFGVKGNESINLSTNEKFLPNFRGSTPGFEYEGVIYFLVHIVEYSTPRHYYHSIVKFDAETFNYIDHSKLFTFEGEKIEYGLGIIVEDDRVIISHSTWDSSAKVKVYNKEKLFKDVFS